MLDARRGHALRMRMRVPLLAHDDRGQSTSTISDRYRVQCAMTGVGRLFAFAIRPES